MIPEVHENDVGTEFVLTLTSDGSTAVDISMCTTLQIVFKKPDGSTVTKDAELTGDGTDGIMQYAAEAGLLTPAGLWSLQALVGWDSGNQFRSDVQEFQVHENL